MALGKDSVHHHKSRSSGGGRSCRTQRGRNGGPASATPPSDALSRLPDAVQCLIIGWSGEALSLGCTSKKLRSLTDLPTPDIDAAWVAPMRWLDPACGLIISGQGTAMEQYRRLAKAAAPAGGSWFALARALYSRTCRRPGCTNRARWVCWSNGGSQPLGRVCRECYSQEEASGKGESSSAVVINRAFFDDAPVGTFNNPCALLAALQEATEGQSFAVEGTLVINHDRDIFDLLALWFEDWDNPAIRLVGVPPRTTWHPCHGDFFPWSPNRVDQYGYPLSPDHFWTRLCRYESAAAVACGFPSAGLLSLDNPLCFRSPIFVESLRLASGDPSLGRNGYWREEVSEDDMHTMASVFIGWALPYPAAHAPVVLQRCFITAYQGTGIVVEPNSRVGLLQSVVTNSLLLPLAVKKEAVVRLSGSHLIMNMGAIQTGHDAYVYASQLRAANVFCNDLRYSPPTECTDTNDVFDDPAAALATQLCEPDSESWSARNTGVVFLT